MLFKGRDLIEIPFSHAMSCRFHVRKNSKNFINDYYKNVIQMRIFEQVISPMDESDMWEFTGLLPIEPPNYKVKRGKLDRRRK